MLIEGILSWIKKIPTVFRTELKDWIEDIVRSDTKDKYVNEKYIFETYIGDMKHKY